VEDVHLQPDYSVVVLRVTSSNEVAQLFLNKAHQSTTQILRKVFHVLLIGLIYL
jgi:hypothetical protein